MKKIPDIPSLGLVWNTQYFENWIPAIPVLMTWVFIVCDNLELAGSWWLDFWWCLNWFELVLTRSFPKDLDCGEVHFRCLRFWILRVPNKSPENVNYFFCAKETSLFAPLSLWKPAVWIWWLMKQKAYLPSLGFVWKTQYCWDLDPKVCSWWLDIWRCLWMS